MRTKLFLSYSTRDAEWRDRFLDQLRPELSIREDIWLDVNNIEGGAAWVKALRDGIHEAKCALLFITPHYLDRDQYSRKELSMLKDEEKRGLTILPVLVEPCVWDTVRELKSLQFVLWNHARGMRPDGKHERETLIPLSQCGDEGAIVNAIIDVCKQVAKTLGVVGQTTQEERDYLFGDTQRVLGNTIKLREPIHNGDFSVVYRAEIGDQTVAVKSIPDAARRNRLRHLFDNSLKQFKKLSHESFIDIVSSFCDEEPHCLVMEYMDRDEWPTLEKKLAQFPARRLPVEKVARILFSIAGAQDDAHAHELPIGPLSSANVYVNDEWGVKLSPLRVLGQLAQA